MEALEVGVGAARVVAGDVSEGELQLSSKVSHVERHPGQARRPSQTGVRDQSNSTAEFRIFRDPVRAVL